MTRTANEWQRRLDQGRLTKTQIAAAARVISAHVVLGTPPAGSRNTKLDLDEAKVLRNELALSPVLLTNEHTEQGLDWFVRRAVRELGIDQALVDQIFAGFSHFSWDGDVEIEGNPPWVAVVPVWTIHLHDGRTFKYWFASGWRDRRGNSGALFETTGGKHED